MPTCVRWLVPALMAGSVLCVKTASAEPYGPALRVNSLTAGQQRPLTAAAARNGDTGVLWVDDGSGGCFVQRYDGAGRPLQQGDRAVGAAAADVAFSDNGTWAVVRSAPDGDGNGVFLTVYDRAGAVIVPEFRVNDASAGRQGAGSVAMTGAGQLVVSWSEDRADGREALFIKRFQANGAALGPQILVHTTGFSELGQELAIDVLGNIVLTWGEILNASSGTRDRAVFARRYSSTGAAFGPVFRVDTAAAGIIWIPSVAMNASGAFVIVWPSYGVAAPDRWAIYGQRYTAAGAASGSAFQITTATTPGQPWVSVGMADDGSFIASFDDGNFWSNTTTARVFTRSYAASGAPLGAPVSVTTSDMLVGFAEIAVDPFGNALVAYEQANGTTGVDTYARRFSPAGITLQPLANPGLFTGLAGSQGSWRYFKVTVPPGHQTLDVVLSGSSGDADLYVRYGALPTLSQWDGRPFLDGSNEGVRMQRYPAGDWYIGVNGYADYAGASVEAKSY